MRTVYPHFADVTGRDTRYETARSTYVRTVCIWGRTDADATPRHPGGFVVRRRDGTLFVTCPAFTKRQKAAPDAAFEKHLAPLMPRCAARVSSFITDYKKLFPLHLSADADRMCRALFCGLYKVVAEYAVRTWKTAAPTPGTFGDVPIQVWGVRLRLPSNV